MNDTVERTVQFCLQKPNVHNSTLLKNKIKSENETKEKLLKIDAKLTKLRFVNEQKFH